MFERSVGQVTDCSGRGFLAGSKANGCNLPRLLRARGEPFDRDAQHSSLIRSFLTQHGEEEAVEKEKLTFICDSQSQLLAPDPLTAFPRENACQIKDSADTPHQANPDRKATLNSINSFMRFDTQESVLEGDFCLDDTRKTDMYFLLSHLLTSITESMLQLLLEPCPNPFIHAPGR